MTPQETTSILRQGRAIRQQHPETLLLFRTTSTTLDAFGKEAKIIADVCGLKTKRRTCEGGYVEAVSIPFKREEAEIGKLVAAGHKVAVCEPAAMNAADGGA